jgi:hypothetical protein
MIYKNLSNVSEDENISVLIQEMLGDSHINYESLFFLIIIYSIFLVVGVFGNLSTCIVILTNEYMRTATNVYLFNLAIADIATLVICKLSVRLPKAVAYHEYYCYLLPILIWKLRQY